MSRITLKEYAALKGFEPSWLSKLRVHDSEQGLCMDYLDERGHLRSQRLRHHQAASCRFSWRLGMGPLPYGLWLELNQKAGGLVLVEGESDAQSMWAMGLPTLGIPGAATFKAAWAREYLRDRPLWLHVENDGGGQTFLRHTVEKLAEAGYRGQLSRFSCAEIAPDCKDVSDLYLKLGKEPAREAIRLQLRRRLPARWGIVGDPAQSAPRGLWPGPGEGAQGSGLAESGVNAEEDRKAREAGMAGGGGGVAARVSGLCVDGAPAEQGTKAWEVHQPGGVAGTAQSASQSVRSGEREGAMVAQAQGSAADASTGHAEVSARESGQPGVVGGAAQSAAQGVTSGEGQRAESAHISVMSAPGASAEAGAHAQEPGQVGWLGGQVADGPVRVEESGTEGGSAAAGTQVGVMMTPCAAPGVSPVATARPDGGSGYSPVAIPAASYAVPTAGTQVGVMMAPCAASGVSLVAVARTDAGSGCSLVATPAGSNPAPAAGTQGGVMMTPCAASWVSQVAMPNPDGSSVSASVAAPAGSNPISAEGTEVGVMMAPCAAPGASQVATAKPDVKSGLAMVAAPGQSPIVTARAAWEGSEVVSRAPTARPDGCPALAPLTAPGQSPIVTARAAWQGSGIVCRAPTASPDGGSALASLTAPAGSTPLPAATPEGGTVLAPLAAPGLYQVAPQSPAAAPSASPATPSTAPSPTPPSPRHALAAYPAASLYGATLPRPLMVLDQTLTAGLCMLAGAPKKGKSWLALALGLAVARGEPLLGRPTRGGEVLYLDLESRQYRVQERLAALHPGSPPEGLFIAHHAPRLSEGLVPALEGWLRAHPRTALIIVDTLARVKSPGQGGENVYEADSRLMGELQRLALDHGLCLLLIHHLRKSAGGFKESDVYERVSGSTGLTGVCDCVLVLEGKRQESEATLHVDGRDIPARQLVLGFDAGRWALLSEDAEAYRQGSDYDKSPLPAALRRLMQGRESWEGRPQVLAALLSEQSGDTLRLTPKDVYTAISRLMPQLTQREGITARSYYLKGNRHIAITRAEHRDEA